MNAEMPLKNVLSGNPGIFIKTKSFVWHTLIWVQIKDSILFQVNFLPVATSLHSIG